MKEWRHDLIAGMVVSLISLPFSLGIATASGAPPICGLISAIIAGLVLPFLGGSYVTVSGPAAGLAPVLLASMAALGGGFDDEHRAIGYPLLLAAICLTGLVQVILARFKAARLSAIFPAAVVEGMLASIGLLIIAKQLPHLIGRKFEAHEFWGILAEVPSQLAQMNPKVFFVGVSSLILIFALASLKARWLKIVPPQVIAAVYGLVAGAVLGLSGSSLIHIPAQPFAHGIVLPNFAGFFQDHSLWWPLVTIVLTLTMIDGVESLATIAAIDKIDPFRRKSDPNRTLFAMGVSNMCSSMAGGLTIIPGGVKSTACIVSGGRTQWANFYNALFLIVYLLLGRSVINMLPYATLGAVVLYTGYKLCAPKVWKHIAHIGSEQLFVFTATVLVTLSTDLLWGIAAGIVAKFLLEVVIQSRVVRGPVGERDPLHCVVRRWVDQTRELFRDPVVHQEQVGDAYHLYFGRPLVCFNALHLESALDRVPGSAATVYLHVTDLVTMIDHTTASTLLDFIDSLRRSGRSAQVLGLERLRARSEVATALRVNTPVLAAERAEVLRELDRLSLSVVSTEAIDRRAVLEQLSLVRIDEIGLEGGHPVTDSLAAAFVWLARRIRLLIDAARHAWSSSELPEPARERDLGWLSLSRVEPNGKPVEVDSFGLAASGARPEVGTAYFQIL